MSAKDRQDVSLAALVKIARAMQRGTIPGDTIRRYSGLIDVELTTHTASPETVAWYERNFPGGEHRLYQSASFRSRRALHQHRARIWDRWQYSVNLDDGRYRALSVYYSREHECKTFKASSELLHLTGDAAKDFPRWYCADCSKDMTITEARRRGLLPPRGAQ